MTDQTTAPTGVVSSTEFDACRAAFVNMMKEENYLAPSWSKASLRASWAGKQAGFAEHHVQARWQDFRAGWKASTGMTTMAPTSRVRPIN